MRGGRQLRSNIQHRRSLPPGVPLTLPQPKHAQLNDGDGSSDIASVTGTELQGAAADHDRVSKYHTRFVSSYLPQNVSLSHVMSNL